MPIHPILSAAYDRRHAAEQRVLALAAAALATGSVDQLVAASLAYRTADAEVETLETLRLTVNGRTYTLHRAATVRGEA